MTLPLAEENLPKHVTLRRDQVTLLRLIHGAVMEASIATLYQHPTMTRQEFVAKMSEDFQLYRGLDDLLLDGLQLMDETNVANFMFTPGSYAYLLSVSRRQWLPGDFVVFDEDDARTCAELITNGQDDIVLSLKAFSTEPLQYLVPGDARA